MNDKSTVVSRRKFIDSIMKAAAPSIVSITALPNYCNRSNVVNSN